MKILYEDENIIFSVKPVGILSQSDDGGRENMPALLSRVCACQIYPLHRLDREVGGVMVYAKSSISAAKMSALVADHNAFIKVYLAVVEGTPEKSGVLEDLLYHDKVKNKTYTVKRERKGVKKAKLSYDVIENSVIDGKEVSLVKVRLYTGRTHQIRVQFASRGFPIVGDRRYGASAGSDSIHLFSHKISFASPFSKNNLEFFALPEQDGVWANFVKKD